MLDYWKIKEVHVVFMTHFDMGFTDFAGDVLENYMEDYIPKAVQLAEEMNHDGEKRFIWTIGAFLIANYLKVADEAAQKKLCDAIERGDICWHGLAFTTHTELMDQELLNFDLSYSDALDQRFGKQTIASKLTDVPGHTRSIITSMAAHGKKYLHIGVNPSSMNPEVPESFLWKSKGEELMVQYSPVYGSACYAEGMEEVLEFVFLGDNQGLPTKSGIVESLEQLKKRYPNARVCASTLDSYAEQLWKHKDTLPVIREEIGDTWIHGIASDPLKVRKLKQLMRLKSKWIKEGRLHPDGQEYFTFMENLLFVCEHTWALDYKKHLFDFENWTKEDFQQARDFDEVTEKLFTQRNTELKQMVCQEKNVSHLTGSYKAYEYSYEEQRQYLEKAVQALPMELQKEAEAAYEFVEEKKSFRLRSGERHHPHEIIEVNGWNVSFDGSGAMVYLEREGRSFIHTGCFGRFSYETYNAHDTIEEFYQYNHMFKENMPWAEADFGKPGLETVEDLEHKNYVFGLKQIRKYQHIIELELAGNPHAALRYGCPRQACIRYTFGEEIQCELIWSSKDANKMPEGLWFDVSLDVENPYLWEMCVMGETVSPIDVVRGGNRRQHCVEKMSYKGADGSIELVNLDSPLVSMGGRRLYGGCRELPDMTKGFSYCLFNNKWGTNFSMWCEDDGYFHYTLKIKK